MKNVEKLYLNFSEISNCILMNKIMNDCEKIKEITITNGLFTEFYMPLLITSCPALEKIASIQCTLPKCFDFEALLM